MTNAGPGSTCKVRESLEASVQADDWVGVFTHTGIVHHAASLRVPAVDVSDCGSCEMETDPVFPPHATAASTSGTPGRSTNPDITLSTGFPVTFVNVPQKSSARALPYLKRSM